MTEGELLQFEIRRRGVPEYNYIHSEKKKPQNIMSVLFDCLTTGGAKGLLILPFPRLRSRAAKKRAEK